MYACTTPNLDGTCDEWVEVSGSFMQALTVSDAQTILTAFLLLLATVFAWRVLRNLL